MADGSPEDRFGPQQTNELTFSAPDNELRDTKKCSGETFEGDRVKLSFYTELEQSDSCEKSDSRGVAAIRSAAGSRNPYETSIQERDDRKKRRLDRYDSSESSDSGVAVLSPTESSGCSGSDITEPRSPRSPESGCSAGEEASAGPGARMPPWANEPAPPPRRIAAQPAPTRRSNPPLHRRITEFFNHKMKPQTGKREAATPANDDTKRKCLPKNGVTQDLEKYISLLSQTLSPVLDASTHLDRKPVANGAMKATDLSKKASSVNANGIIDFSKKDNKEKNRMSLNGFLEMRNGTESLNKKKPNGLLNGLVDNKKNGYDLKGAMDPSANKNVKLNKQLKEPKRKVSMSAANDLTSLRIAPAILSQTIIKPTIAKADSTKINGVVSSTTTLDNRMNGVTCGSNNISLNNVSCKPTPKKETTKKTQIQPSKRTNRKSSACIANSKNLTWSKANNLKQQVQKQNCVNAAQQHGSPVKTIPEASTAPKMNIPNGVRQVSMTVNGNLGGLNVPVNNLQNCHQINIPQPCNGTVTSTNLPSFVAVPQNVMLTTLRIPQNGMQPQTMNQQSNLNAFNRPNVNGVNGVNMSNVSSPSKLNGQFVFPYGTTVLQIPNFVLPQTTQLATQRPDHLQNQQAAQILINGTLLKLANTMNPTYANINNMNKPAVTSQSIPVINKNMTGMPTVGMTVQSKPNYTVNYSHPVLVPQPGFIVTSVPNMNVKETWSYTGANSASSTTCSNPVVHHPTPMVTNYNTHALHARSIPIAPVKPPDNPIQGTEPPSSTVKEPDMNEISNPKYDMPWLSKTVNNNILPLNKIPSRAFAEVSGLSGKYDKPINKFTDGKICEKKEKDKGVSCTENIESLRKIEEVARREDTIFTQITVLKDVSSNVQNSVIEANYSSATTESSESGIGTDKSIDSPSDSQTSKECDEDSSISLSVSVCDEVVSSQKSPILKQPKTLRFPPRNPVKPPSSGKRTSSTDTTSTVVLCLWEECKSEFDNNADLLEHLQSCHVESQAGKENYVCLWQSCKVRGKPSCSRLWLERHALSHGGNKPFKCIVDNCDRRFSTQILLERHVNNHFTESSPNNNGNKKTADSASKLIRRNGKKLRYRRQPWSARMFDFFDTGIMEGLAWRLARCTRWRLGGSCPLREPPGRHTLTLHAALTATRYNAQESRREALLTYYPPHVLEDEWVPEKDVKRIKRVEISDLPIATKVRLYEQFTCSYRKTPSPPPVKKELPAPTPSRTLPNRHCSSSRLLNNLLKKKEVKPDCSATNVPMIYGDEEREKVEVSGAKKRKMGRRHGGNAFWPCGR